jgi:hypothetical protein
MSSEPLAPGSEIAPGYEVIQQLLTHVWGYEQDSDTSW